MNKPDQFNVYWLRHLIQEKFKGPQGFGWPDTVPNEELMAWDICLKH